MSATYSLDEVATHNSKDDCWLVINDVVYDVTEFMDEHPGGSAMLKMVAGKDATMHFEELHKPAILETIASSFKIGVIGEGGPEADAPSHVDAETASTGNVYSMEEVAKHNSSGDTWMVISGKVYDVSEFMDIHPGGAGMLKMVAGKDATMHFEELHKPEILTSIAAEYLIGTVGDTSVTEAAPETSAAPAAAGKVYTWAEVAKHNTKSDCWLVIDGGVYDVTEFMDEHPGGAGMLKMVAGKDASLHFEELHKPEILTTIGSAFYIGTVSDGDSDEVDIEEVPAEEPADAKADQQAEVEALEGLAGYTMAEISTHNKIDDCWVVIDGKVYDVSNFMEDHPGGAKALMLYAGQDGTEEFTMLHHPDIIKTYGTPLLKGKVVEEDAVTAEMEARLTAMESKLDAILDLLEKAKL
eukprot:SAG31_NODE_419_length_15872_cov_21.857985_13_plen_412_part_00